MLSSWFGTVFAVSNNASQPSPIPSDIWLPFFSVQHETMSSSSTPRGCRKLLCISLCIVLAFGVEAASADDQFVYSGFAGANVTLDGAAVVTSSGLLELTNGTLRQKAHAIHPAQLRFREASNGTGTGTARSFSASFVFGILCPDADACGHGIVLFVAPASYDLATAFPSQYIGLVNGSTNGDVGTDLRRGVRHGATPAGGDRGD